jgi:hypothetical protein
MHALSRIQTSDPRNQDSADIRLKPHGQWARLPQYVAALFQLRLLKTLVVDLQ